MTIKCLYCPFEAIDVEELLEHEDKEHTALIEALDGVDGNEKEEDITGEDPADED